MVRPRAAACDARGPKRPARRGLAFSADHPQRDPVTGQKTPGEPGHTRDTQAHTRTHRSQRRTSQATKPCNDTPARPDATAETRNRQTAADSTAARTAAGPEPTTPRGRLRRGRPQRTRPPASTRNRYACVCKTRCHVQFCARCIRHAYRYLPVIYTKHAPKRRAHPARAAAIRRPR